MFCNTVSIFKNTVNTKLIVNMQRFVAVVHFVFVFFLPTTSAQKVFL